MSHALCNLVCAVFCSQIKSYVMALNNEGTVKYDEVKLQSAEMTKHPAYMIRNQRATWRLCFVALIKRGRAPRPNSYYSDLFLLHDWSHQIIQPSLPSIILSPESFLHLEPSLQRNNTRPESGN